MMDPNKTNAHLLKQCYSSEECASPLVSQAKKLFIMIYDRLGLHRYRLTAKVGAVHLGWEVHELCHTVNLGLVTDTQPDLQLARLDVCGCGA